MDDAREIAGRLSQSERIVMKDGRTWSSQQRSRLISRGLVEESARGAPCLPKQYYENPCWALPLTPLGLQVRQVLQERQDG